MIKTIKPPPDFTRKGKIYLPKHHSVADWDFENGATNRSLSATQFVSAPTSLKMISPTWVDTYETILCRIDTTQCLPQGEIRNWHYKHEQHLDPACFRNQAALGSANHANCYSIYLAGTNCYLGRYIANVLSIRAQTTCQVTIDTWQHWRVVFWNGLNPDLLEALCVSLYREVAGEWVQEGETMYDTDNSFKDSATNRCGFIARFYAHIQYWDDTEIWGPV